MYTKFTRKLLAAIALTAAATAAGQPLPARATSHAHGTAEAAAVALSDGEVRRVDKNARKLTIRHGPLDNLGMPAMTMVFQVADAAMLENVTAGDRIRFIAEKIGGAYTVTRLEPVK